MPRPTRRLPTTILLPLLMLVMGGCAAVPRVESQLESLRFYPNMYVVRAGDTLETIAWRHRLSPGELAALNPGVSSGPLATGRRINVRPGTELADAVRNRSVSRPSVRALPTVQPSNEWGATPREATPVVISPVVRDPVATRASVRAPASWSEPAPSSAWPESATSADGLAPGRSRADEELLPADTDGGAFVREEIVPDDLDDPMVATAVARDSMDDELQRYVGRWTWPIDGAVARSFAPGRPDGQGVDIAGVPGEDVRAALDGTVVYSGRDLSDGGGRLVIVRHDDDLMTTYSHADELYVAEDDRVLAGDPIASLGTNARSESVLRFEVRRDGSPLDPMAFLPTVR